MSRRARRIVVIALFIAAMSGLVWSLWSRDRNLLKIATRIPGGSLPTGAYQWLTNDSILIAREDGLADRLDLLTGQRQPLEALNAVIGPVASKRREPTILLSTARISPDGQWLLWTPYTHGIHPWNVDRLDGSRHIRHEFDHCDDWSPVWLPDSRGWATLAISPDGVHEICTTFDLRHPQPVSQVMMPGGQGDWEVVAATRTGTIVYLATGAFDGMHQAFDLLELSIAGSSLPRRMIVHTSSPAAVIECQYSPVCDRIAFLVSVDPNAEESAILRWFDKLLGRRTQTRDEIWTTRLDGKDLRRIGYIYRHVPDDPAVQSLQWTRNSKRISFLADRTLYTVPAD